jgi:hypothetical protein
MIVSKSYKESVSDDILMFIISCDETSFTRYFIILFCSLVMRLFLRNTSIQNCHEDDGVQFITQSCFEAVLCYKYSVHAV